MIMESKYKNIFFVFGIIVLGIMVTQLDFAEAWGGICHAGYWFAAVVALWAFLYVLNTLSWWIIIRSQKETATPVPDKSKGLRGAMEFFWLYRVTISGFALNYATPGGLMGGEPYRIMSLKRKIGVERASSSVILYVMTHIFSHFWFWLLSILLFVVVRKVTMPTCIMLIVTAVVCLAAIWFFLRGYKRGLAVSAMRIAGHIPFLKRWAGKFVSSNSERLAEIDKQIASLHNQNRLTFLLAVCLELLCRFFSAFEIMFVLLVIVPDISYWDCVIILAFTSLFANILFFMPLQLGGREGGFLMSATGLGLTASAGVLVALIVRLRELIWTGIGLFLIKFDK